MEECELTLTEVSLDVPVWESQKLDEVYQVQQFRELQQNLKCK